MPIKNIQLGKKGVTNNFIENLKNQFKKAKIVKISVLKSATRNREELRKINEEILRLMGSKFSSKIIGFTIVFRK